MKTVDSRTRRTFTSAEVVLAEAAAATVDLIDLIAMNMELESPSKPVEWAWLMTSLVVYKIIYYVGVF